jgi:hypothetical protein
MSGRISSGSVNSDRVTMFCESQRPLHCDTIVLPKFKPRHNPLVYCDKLDARTCFINASLLIPQSMSSWPSFHHEVGVSSVGVSNEIGVST